MTPFIKLLDVLWGVVRLYDAVSERIREARMDPPKTATPLSWKDVKRMNDAARQAGPGQAKRPGA